MRITTSRKHLQESPVVLILETDDEAKDFFSIIEAATALGAEYDDREYDDFGGLTERERALAEAMLEASA